MPTFENFTQSQLIKALYLGDSSVGKTGSLVALAAAGYNVRILDLDNGVELLRDFVTNKTASMYLRESPGRWTAAQAAGTPGRLSYITITETFHTIQGRFLPKADAWGKMNKQLDNWVDGGQVFGNIDKWSSGDVLVIDGLTKMANAAWNWQLAMNGRLTGKPEQNDYWQAQKLVKDVLLVLQGTSTPCHVIVICHVDYIENDSGLTRGYPKTIGKALSIQLAQDWNHTLLAKSSGQGAGVKRKIFTTTTGTIDLKNTAPLRVKPEYDLETGLADYFKDVLGHGVTAPIAVVPVQAKA